VIFFQACTNTSSETTYNGIDDGSLIRHVDGLVDLRCYLLELLIVIDFLILNLGNLGNLHDVISLNLDIHLYLNLCYCSQQSKPKPHNELDFQLYLELCNII